MRTSPPDLLPIFRSQLQGELLALVLLSTEEHSVSDLARQLDAPVPTVQREVSRLQRAGILATRRLGQTRLVSANPSSPIVSPLTELVLRTFGPPLVLARELAAVAGIERAEIFGSWAARHLGEPGPPPGDIDLLIIGEPDRDEVYDAAQRAERRLGRQVNPVIVSAARWRDNTEPFLQHLHARPRVAVIPAEPGTTGVAT